VSTTFYIKENDTSPILQSTLQDASGAGVLLVGATVRIHVVDRYGTVLIDDAATVSDAANGIVTYEFDGTQSIGNLLYEFEVTYSDTSIETFPNVGYDLMIVTKDLA